MTALGYDCLAPSVPAHDTSPDQPLRVGGQSLRDYLAFLEQMVATREDRRPPIIIGHSMGGLLARQLAARVQSLALVLLAPAAPYDITNISLTNTDIFLHYIRNGAFWRNGYKPDFARAQRFAFHGVSSDRHRSLYAGLVHESGRALFETALWPLDFSRSSAVDAEWIRCPVYIVSGGKDRLIPASLVRKVTCLYPHAIQRNYPTRGHWMIDDEHTDEMVSSVYGWLQSIQQKQEHGRHS
jgi:pimeloyl-ACP methyl ester carboxylesterase